VAEQQLSDIHAPSFRVGSVLERGFSIYFHKFLPFTFLALFLNLLVLPLEFAFAEADTLESIWAPVFFYFFAYYAVTGLVNGMLVFGTIQVLRGQPANLGDVVGHGLRVLFPVLGVVIVAGIAVVVGAVLLVVPGFILMVLFWVAIPVAVIERPGVFASMKRSATLTKGNRWRIFAIVAILLLIGIVVTAVLELVLPVVFGTTTFILFDWAVQSALAALGAVMTAVGYHDLRVAREGIDIETIAAVFD